jgi:hypothetical protein
MTKASDNPFPSILVAEQGSAPTTPASGYGRIYCKADGLYFIGDNGTEVGPLASSSGGGYTQGAKVYHNTDQSLLNGDVLTVAFNSEFYDTDTCHDNSTNNSRLTCKSAGKYLVGACGVFSAGLSTDPSIWIEHNTKGRIVQFSPLGLKAFSISAVVDLAQNDYLVLKIYNPSGTPTLNYSTGNEYSPAFWMQRIG